MTHIAVIGGGKIGQALISGLREAGTPASNIVLVDRNEQNRALVKERYGVISNDVDNAVDDCDVLVIAVKPKDVTALLESIADAVDNADQDPIIVSMAAGISLKVLQHFLSAGTPVIRVMPNTPMLYGKGVSAVAPGQFVSEEQVALVSSLMDTVGQTVIIEESQMDAVTAVSGSGPAYFFLAAEAMIDAAVSMGLKRDLAEQLAHHTIAGAGTMLVDSADGATTLRHNVSSPGGTTAAAIASFERTGLRASFYDAMQACAEKSAAMGAQAEGEIWELGGHD